MPVLMLLLCILALGCERSGTRPASTAERGRPAPEGVAVDVQTAARERLSAPVESVGTTSPVQSAVLRARVEGRVETIDVGMGEAVSRGDTVARLDASLLRQQLTSAQAAAATARAEAAATLTALREARARAAQARVEEARYARLAERGIVSREDAEGRVLAATTAREQVKSVEAQQAAQQARVRSLVALEAQARERLSYATVKAPFEGRVLEQLTDPGNLLSVGDPIVSIGDLSRIEIITPVSERAFGRLEVGQRVRVRLDAFPDEAFEGTIAFLTAQADPRTRLLPITVEVSNTTGRISAGLLARVELAPPGAERVVVPETAILGRTGPEPLGRGDGAQQATVFVVSPIDPSAGAPPAGAPGDRATHIAQKRTVVLGSVADGRVEILEGLRAGEAFVARSERPLNDGDRIRLSALSRPGGQP